MPYPVHRRRLGLAPFLLVVAWLALTPAQAQPTWRLRLSVQRGTPSGRIRVREFDRRGTPLKLSGDLGIDRLQTVDLSADRSLGDVAAIHLGINSMSLTGSAILAHPIEFNGTRIASGEISTVTGFPNFLRVDASYRHQLASFGHGAGLWGGIGVTYVMLNFKLHATVAADSRGHETKEDFLTQELPVPMLSLHFIYPLTTGLDLFADLDGGHLPWVNSLRKEGGEVRLTQTNTDARIGLSYRFAQRWNVAVFGYSRYFMQGERSSEDGNYFHLHDHGIGLGVMYLF
ncbi:MAG TPA: hypothetical protein VFK24_08865 [Gammaproteobacteria bacterium]|nr:hypothetical protein [Gammaproteobacteria bacterium]